MAKYRKLKMTTIKLNLNGCFKYVQTDSMEDDMC